MKSNHMIKSEREAVLDILLNVLEEGCFSGNAMDQELNRQSRTPESRAFITRLCEGTIERLITIDDVIDSCASVKCRKMKPVIRNILRESVYQMLFMDNVADAVAVNEAVSLAKKRGFSGLTKFVNGVLRTVGRKKGDFSFYIEKKLVSENVEKTGAKNTGIEKTEYFTERAETEKEKKALFTEKEKSGIAKTGIEKTEFLTGKEYIVEQKEKNEDRRYEKKTDVRRDDGNSNWEKYVSTYYSVPVWLARHMENAVGRDQAEAVFREFLTVRPLQARVNFSGIQKRRAVESLAAEGMRVSDHPYLENVIRLESASGLTRTGAFRKGWIQIQDASSVLAVAAAGICPGMRVLDVCAAPGGKSLYAADLLMDKNIVSGNEESLGNSTDFDTRETVISGDMSGAVIEKTVIRQEVNCVANNGVPEKTAVPLSCVRSRDLTEGKVAKIRENAVRCHFEEVIQPEVADARIFDPALEGWADVVIADLPCSGLGVIAKKPDIKYRVHPEDLKNLAALQREILSVVWRYVKPGGVLIYSTCTVSPEENQKNVRWFLSQGYPMEADDMTPYLPERFLAELDQRQNTAKKQETAGQISGREDRIPERQNTAEAQGAGKLSELQLLPGEYETDGFFISRFRRNPKQEHDNFTSYDAGVKSSEHGNDTTG